MAERQREAEVITAVTAAHNAAAPGAAGEGEREGRGGAAAAGPSWHAERALAPDKLAPECSGYEYRAFL